MAKTEIVKLETSVKDLERSLSLYTARLKTFEERERVQSAERLHGTFPSNLNTCRSSYSSTQGTGSASYPQGTCSASFPQPPSHPPHCPSTCQQINAPQLNSPHLQSIDDKLHLICLELRGIKYSIQKLPNSMTGGEHSQPDSLPAMAPRSSAPTTATSECAALSECARGSQDESITSLDEFVPTVAEETLPLNSIDLTNQLS